MPQSFADLLRMLTPDASLLRRAAKAPDATAAPQADPASPSATVRLSLMSRMRAAMPSARRSQGAEVEDVAARRLAAMARAERAREGRSHGRSVSQGMA